MGRSANVVMNYSTSPLRDVFDVEASRRRSEEVAGRLGPSSFNMPWMNARADLIAAQLLAGDLGAVRASWQTTFEDAEASQGWERWLVAGRLCAARAQLELGLGNADESIEWARRALRFARDVSRRKYEVVALIDLGLALTAGRASEEAVRELDEAVAKADGLGTPLLRWQARAALADALATSPALGRDADEPRAAAVGLIHEVAGALSPERSRTYLEAPQVVRVLDALG